MLLMLKLNTYYPSRSAGSVHSFFKCVFMIINYLKEIGAEKCFIFLLLIASCSGRVAGGDFEAFFKDLCSAHTLQSALQYYTEGTEDALKRAVKKGIVHNNNRLALLPRFNAETEIKILKEEISGSDANVTVKYINHPVENMIGFKTVFRFKWENNRWKLDMEREIDSLIKRNNSGAGSEYLRKKFKGY